jgi:hypothetical protein
MANSKTTSGLKDLRTTSRLQQQQWWMARTEGGRQVRGKDDRKMGTVS